jgi:hypothetical protein
MASMSMEDKYPNWFAVTAQENFEKFLLPLAGQDYLRFLQLGVYTGDATSWLCKNVLNESCSLWDVDTWEGSDEEVHKSIDFREVIKIYKSKLKDYKYITPFAMTTYSFLVGTMAQMKQDYFHFIYVDADHTTVGVILDAEMSWPLLKSGGIMAFDDYEWGSNLPQHLRPKAGIDLFLLRHQGEYELLTKNQQVWIKKI